MPGASIALLLRHSIGHGKKYGIATALGLTLGDTIHILLIIFGLTSIILTNFISLNTFKTLGAIYFIYLGCKTIKSQNTSPVPIKNKSSYKTIRVSFIEGLLTSVTNPSVLLFFSSMFLIIMEDNITTYELFCWSLLIISMTINKHLNV